jgi:hypothetical protein
VLGSLSWLDGSMGYMAAMELCFGIGVLLGSLRGIEGFSLMYIQYIGRVSLSLSKATISVSTITNMTTPLLN